MIKIFTFIIICLFGYNVLSSPKQRFIIDVYSIQGMKDCRVEVESLVTFNKYKIIIDGCDPETIENRKLLDNFIEDIKDYEGLK